MERRDFLRTGAIAASGLVFSNTVLGVDNYLKNNSMEQFENSPVHTRFRPKHKAGFGGVAVGNGFNENPSVPCMQSVEAAWDAGIRYFDTSPWYGLGISERRMGLALKDKNRDEYTLSTKIGRVLYPHEDFDASKTIWKGKMNFGYRYDYTAEGTRRSVEDSLQRLGVSSLDIVFIHDLSPDNGDMKDNWMAYFDIAAKGAMPELMKMREEGLIKGWGFGVNTIDPIVKAMEVSDPDIFLSACQYSLIHHKDALNKVFPLAEKRDVSIVVGAPFAAGLLAGKDRYLYGGEMPDWVVEKYGKMKRIAQDYQVDLRSAALQFAAAPAVVSAVIPGAHTVQQAQENVASFSEKIPADFWAALRQEKLIEENAVTPR